ncbi:MAG: hypothetical protein ACTSRW_04825 [Candidatus Helarchaeota archaeon]
MKSFQNKSKQGEGYILSYGDNTILLNDSDLIRSALILDDMPSEEVRQKLDAFTKEFETQYRATLEQWKGELAPFQNAGPIVAKTLELTLLYPQQLTDLGKTILSGKVPKGLVTITDLEKGLVKLVNSMMITNKVDYIYLPALIELAEVRKESRLEIVGAVYQLVKKGILKPMMS